MARVIVILTLLAAITAAMFAITRRPPIAPGEAADGSVTTVQLNELQQLAKSAIPEGDGETSSLVAAPPRTVTAEPPASTQDLTKGPVAGAAPTLGTAGIDHKGRASFTGTASPDETVTLVWDDRPVGTAKADALGNWEIVFKAPVTKGGHELFVYTQAKDGSVVIGPQRATIRPPATEGGLARITLKAADQSAKTLQEGTVAAAAEVKTGIIVEKIAGSEDGVATLTGKADPGATVKAVINGKPAGETRVGDDGAWTLAALNPSRKAAKSIRLELVGKEGSTLDRADVPYKVAAASKTTKLASAKAEFPAVLTSAPQPKGKDEGREDLAALFVPEKVETTPERPKDRVIRVRKGDSLWRISKRHLGKGRKWARFYKANKAKIDNPDLIYPGQTLVIPG